MEAANLTLRGPDADRFASAFLEAKTSEARTSLNKRGVRNIHRYGGIGSPRSRTSGARPTRTRGWSSPCSSTSWTRRPVQSRSLSVGRRGPVQTREAVGPPAAQRRGVGRSGRYAAVLEDIETVCADLSLTVETEWESETEPDVTTTLQRKIFEK